MTLSSSNLRIFEAVARQQSFTRAALELGVRQPYVSAQIAALEAKLDLTLLRRVGRRVYLTDAGTQLYDRARGLLNGLAAAEQAMAGLRSRVAGRLECATTIIPAEYILPAFLENLMEVYPGLQVVLQVSGSREVEAAVLDGRYELGITLSHTIPERLDGLRLGKDELVVVVSPAHRLARRDSIFPGDLATETLIVREASSGTRIFVESVFKQLGLTIRQGPELNNNEVIKALVANRLGIAILSTRAVSREVESGRLRALRLRGVRFERPITLIVNKQQPLTKIACLFQSLLGAWCDSHLERFEETISPASELLS